MLNQCQFTKQLSITIIANGPLADFSAHFAVGKSFRLHFMLTEMHRVTRVAQLSLIRFESLIFFETHF